MLRRPIARPARRGLIGTAARTAVIAGTATAVSGHVARNQSARTQQAADAQAYEQQQFASQQAPQQPAPPAGAAGDIVTQLTQLASLRDQGVLTDAEFDAQKAKLLGT